MAPLSSGNSLLAGLLICGVNRSRNFSSSPGKHLTNESTSSCCNPPVKVTRERSLFWPISLSILSANPSEPSSSQLTPFSFAWVRSAPCNCAAKRVAPRSCALVRSALCNCAYKSSAPFSQLSRKFMPRPSKTPGSSPNSKVSRLWISSEGFAACFSLYSFSPVVPRIWAQRMSSTVWRNFGMSSARWKSS